jgi:YHS domain-containing protein
MANINIGVVMTSKNKFIISGIVTLLTMMSLIMYLNADSDKKGSHKHSTKHDKTTMAYSFMSKGTQKVCPVREEPIDKSVSIDFQGQRIYFCCAGCDTDFLEAPEKYYSEMKGRGEITDSIQQKCAVSGEKLEDHGTYLTLSGRKIYFCCKDCRSKFKKNKEKYLTHLGKKDAPLEAHDHSKHEHGNQEHKK